MYKPIISIFILILLLSLFSCNNKPAYDPIPSRVDYVNILVGTPWKGNGGTLPAVGKPFAMTNFVPATNINAIGNTPYHYEMNEIIGFMGTHQPAVWMGDYGFFTLWPSTRKVKIKPGERKYLFSHDKEIATPYYYSAGLIAQDSTYEITTKYTATERCAYFVFRFPKTDTSYIVIEASRNNGYNHKENVLKEMFDEAYINTIDSTRNFKGYVKIDKERNEIYGYNPERHSFHLGPALKNFRGYFVMRFEMPFISHGTWQDTSIYPGQKESTGKWTGAYAGFNTNIDRKVRIKIGTSFISVAQARENLQNEITYWDFDHIKNMTRDAWNEKLNTIQIKGATENQKAIFYTAMYHSMLYPRIFSEYGQYYSAFDDTIHKGVAYNDYSLWDTYRALHPLLTFIAPEHVNPMIQSLINMYNEGGWMPKWPNPAYSNIMIGTHADAVIADAFIKGFRDYDIEKAYEAMKKNAFTPPPGDTGNTNYVNSPWKEQKIITLPPGAGNPWWDRELFHGYEARGGLAWYKKYGYVPANMTSESVSRTLEFAYDDYCVAQVAKGLGKTIDYQELIKRSKNYKNVYHPETGFMTPRMHDGTWLPLEAKGNVGPEVHHGFTEGSHWTYLFCAMHDIEGLIKLMGGTNAFAEKMDSNFTGGHYEHQNEPGHHYVYLYNYAGMPEKTQEKARQYTLSQYKNAPDGLDGNDDCGQMSAWYIFSSMGFYPVCPGSGEYAIGSPLFPEVVIFLPNNKPFHIIAKNVSEKNKYIQSATLNGTPLERPFIKHVDIMNNDTLLFKMGSKPGKIWK